MLAGNMILGLQGVDGKMITMQFMSYLIVRNVCSVNVLPVAFRNVCATERFSYIYAIENQPMRFICAETAS